MPHHPTVKSRYIIKIKVYFKIIILKITFFISFILPTRDGALSIASFTLLVLQQFSHPPEPVTCLSIPTGV